MSEHFYPQGWFPVATSKQLGRKPLRRELCGKAIVVYRTPDGVAALHDHCPHRSAPLSQGRVVDGEIECPYHGWRFGADGRCTLIPFHDGEVPKRMVPALAVREAHGLVFVRHGEGPEDIHTPFWRGDGRWLRSTVLTSAEISLLDVMENVLDPTHTAFTHKNLMRGMTERRKDVTFTLSERDGMLQLDLSGEEQQDGLISRLTGETGRTGSTTYVVNPGIVEIVYWGRNGISVVTTVYFSPASPDRTNGFILVTAPMQRGLAYLKAAVFLPIFRRIIRQDEHILAASHANWKAFGRPRKATSPLDYIRPSVEAMLEGRETPVAGEPSTFVLRL